MEETQEPKPTQGERKLEDATARVEAAKALDEADKIAAKTQMRSDARKALRIVKPIQIGVALAAVVAVALAVVFVAIPAIQNKDKKATILTETQLQEVVAINKLSTARSVYKGVAVKYNDDGQVAYHVYYKSDVTAGINMTEITYTIDEENKTVTPVLPEPTIDTPEVDASSIEFFEKNPNVDMKEALSLCKQDALEKVSQSADIKSYATANLQKTVEALMEPLLNNKGYSLKWGQVNESQEGTDTQDDSTAVDAEQQSQEENNDAQNE